MKEILEKIKKQQELTGLTIHFNPYNYNSYVKDSNGKVVFEGDPISCQVFINKAETLLTPKTKEQ